MTLLEPWIWAGWAGVITLATLLFLLVATSWVAITKSPNGDTLLLGFAQVQTYLALFTATMFIVNWPPICGRLGSLIHTSIWMIMLSHILTILAANFTVIVLTVGIVTMRYQRRLEPTLMGILGLCSGILAVAGNVIVISTIIHAYRVQ